ncbi:hypothetical protein POSPLADRAFT_1054624 [Postia placenta MAD-698-R-SB12]|uniref:Uncharacterized protein n=1 Tax=Postia placenta MAD-698-R-SB12 TaxID=670580 RepID=A0A1X6N5V7_9APHY|nr:hypothetical protein POSPLADRAFT_1054624 [Postia placenta MAD-698-R-SB12]OSX63998.1 hypothetical protein POSPLADRAFT_1054624 [Postia placenta MAD-698-R-SB12]
MSTHEQIATHWDGDASSSINAQIVQLGTITPEDEGEIATQVYKYARGIGDEITRLRFYYWLLDYFVWHPSFYPSGNTPLVLACQLDPVTVLLTTRITDLSILGQRYLPPWEQRVQDYCASLNLQSSMDLPPQDCDEDKDTDSEWRTILQEFTWDWNTTPSVMSPASGSLYDDGATGIATDVTPQLSTVSTIPIQPIEIKGAPQTLEICASQVFASQQSPDLGADAPQYSQPSAETNGSPEPESPLTEVDTTRCSSPATPSPATPSPEIPYAEPSAVEVEESIAHRRRSARLAARNPVAA